MVKFNNHRLRFPILRVRSERWCMYPKVPWQTCQTLRASISRTGLTTCKESRINNQVERAQKTLRKRMRTKRRMRSQRTFKMLMQSIKMTWPSSRSIISSFKRTRSCTVQMQPQLNNWKSFHNKEADLSKCRSKGNETSPRWTHRSKTTS